MAEVGHSYRQTGTLPLTHSSRRFAAQMLGLEEIARALDRGVLGFFSGVSCNYSAYSVAMLAEACYID